MTGASIEATLELWASSLREVKGRMRGLFTQERVATSANLFLDGLLGDERRKTGWMRAEAAGDPGPWRQQAILGRGRWDADALRDIVETMLLKALQRKRRSWSLARLASSSKARLPVALRVNIPDQLARSRTARLAYSLLMCRLAATCDAAERRAFRAARSPSSPRRSRAGRSWCRSSTSRPPGARRGR